MHKSNSSHVSPLWNQSKHSGEDLRSCRKAEAQSLNWFKLGITRCLPLPMPTILETADCSSPDPDGPVLPRCLSPTFCPILLEVPEPGQTSRYEKGTQEVPKTQEEGGGKGQCTWNKEPLPSCPPNSRNLEKTSAILESLPTAVERKQGTFKTSSPFWTNVVLHLSQNGITMLELSVYLNGGGRLRHLELGPGINNKEALHLE